ncbi:hypothetical protein HUT18_18385 [Streptomyces sp. NA04227]|uniref:hypothetical protein n=1 Tax=Streptomyces sp. NA04227 TaxID=2742136 RepID=UPI001591A704|nr:hypothetical protein [Streptomyces sp. NA04227]QKW08056.1 hypothetical protein HUT18_18385 [Streptomyces sp. NA04227]
MNSNHNSDNAQPLGISTVVAGALVEFLEGTQLVTGTEDADPASRATRIALETSTAGRGNSRVFTASLDVIEVITEYAETLLYADERSRDEERAARGWLARVPKMRSEVRRLYRANGKAVVHRFTSTRSAYDATQTRDDIEDGDLLLIEREQVVGFLNSAWPVAITEQHGELHGLKVPAREIEDGMYVASVDAAERLAARLGFALAQTSADSEGAGELAEAVTAVEQSEAADGTWRREWIGAEPSQQLTLDGTEPDGQQGALFT